MKPMLTIELHAVTMDTIKLLLASYIGSYVTNF